MGIYAATLQGPPARVALLLREPSRTAGTFAFWFLSDLGRNYSAQYHDDAPTPGWHTVTNLIGNGSTVWVTDAAPAPQRLYRVIVE